MVAALAFLAATLLTVTFAPIMLERRIFRLSERMLHDTTPLRESADRVARAVAEEQSSERGYLMTGDRRLLKAYRHAATELDTALINASQNADEGSRAYVSAVQLAAQNWRKVVAEPRIHAVETGHWRSVLDAEARGEGADAFVALQVAANDLVAHTANLFEAQDTKRHNLAHWLDISLVGLGMAGLVGLALLSYVVLASLRLQGEAREAHELNRLKDEFLSLVGHEIRTPVTVIRLVAESIRRHERSEHTLDGWTAERLRTVERQSHRISWLVDQLLDVGSVPGGIELSRRPVDAVGLTERALHNVQETAPSYPLHFAANERRAAAELDDQRIEQVLTHLIGNAVKFSPRPRTVRVNLEVSETELQWVIADQGMGIPRREQGRLFQRFYRASNAESTNSAGIGLGLHLCQVIILAHGGRIWFESTPHRGSTFHVTLPRYAPPPAEVGEHPEIAEESEAAPEPAPREERQPEPQAAH